MEQVDILTPPTYEKSGVVKPISEAIQNGDWIGTFNLWIIQTDPEPAIVYQQRSPNSTWEPSKLDVSAGGHYQAGEYMFDGLREVQEELGKTYDKDQLIYLGHRLNVSTDTNNYERRNVVDVFLVTDNSPLESYDLQKEEVSAIAACPIDKLIEAHDKSASFNVEALDCDKKKTNIEVTKDSFPYNRDDYHYKIALLAKRYVSGEKNLLY